jgi:hypothetical protein
MDEERPEDANVVPQYLVDSLIKSVDSRLQGYMQNHQLWRWNNTPDTPYGGRVAASARLQRASHVTSLSYPFAGYNPNHQELTPEGRRTVPSLACVANPPPTCAEVGSDTSVCFQVVMDREGQWLRHYKRFCDSIGAQFVPFMQEFSGQERPVPVDCSSDTSWYGGTRPTTKGEAKCHAGVALANGVNGLVYFRYAGYQESVKIKLPCQPDSVVFYTLRHGGLNTLPELQAALAEWVGPFVDSLGHFFADFTWRGGGRVDPHSDSAGLVTMFDSVRSLTFTAPDDSAYIEAGVYALAGSDYFLLVNRRAYDTIPQSIRVYMPIDSAAYIVDQYSHDTSYVATCTGHGFFDATLPPGEGKLFKIAPAPGRTQWAWPLVTSLATRWPVQM